jgi:hypothetical protein
MIKKLACLAAAAISLAGAGPALADSEYPMVPGNYVDVAMLTIDDGHNLEYAKFLAGVWRKQEEFAKSQGWITDYAVMENVDKRPGEPDIYLMTYFKSMPDTAESMKRDEAYRKFMATTDTQMEQASAQRASYRHQLGSMLLQELKFK